MPSYDSYYPLFYSQEMNCYLATKEKVTYRIYEIKDDNILALFLPYQQSWQFYVTLVYKYPVCIFLHDSKQWYVFKEIVNFKIEERIVICLSFLEKLLLYSFSNEEIYFFIDSTNLWFNDCYHCELFYHPKADRLQQKYSDEDTLYHLAKFVFRHIHLLTTLDPTLYNEEYVSLCKHVQTLGHYSSIVALYDEVYTVKKTYYEIEKTPRIKTNRDSVVKITIILFMSSITLLYALYTIGFIKQYYDQQYHDLYSIGNQSLIEKGD